MGSRHPRQNFYNPRFFLTHAKNLRTQDTHATHAIYAKIWKFKHFLFNSIQNYTYVKIFIFDIITND